MEEYSKELLRSGIIEAKTGNHETARRYLDRAIYMTSSHDVLAELVSDGGSHSQSCRKKKSPGELSFARPETCAGAPRVGDPRWKN